MGRTIILLLGLVALALLIFLCVRKHTPEIQDDIQMRTSNILSPAPTNWAKANVDGRNVILTGIAPTEVLREKVAEMARVVPGVARIDNQITVAQKTPEETSHIEPKDTLKPDHKDTPHKEPEPETLHTPYKSVFTKTASRIVLSGLVPDEEQRKALLDLAQEKFGTGKGKVKDKLKVAIGAPEGWLQAAKLAITNLALFNEGTANLTDTQIDLSGHIDSEAKNTIEAELQNQLPDNFKVDFDLVVPPLAIEEIHPEQNTDVTCEEQFKEKVAGLVIHFSTDSTDVTTHAVVGKVLQFSASCPNSKIEVAGFTDARGSKAYNLRLSKNRAAAIVNKLIKRGMRADKLKTAGYGETKPLSSNNTKKGQANNRRIEFKYLQAGE
jgi:outer membrane protein OmpA-like peptidoglycan-associated protein